MDITSPHFAKRKQLSQKRHLRLFLFPPSNYFRYQLSKRPKTIVSNVVRLSFGFQQKSEPEPIPQKIVARVVEERWNQRHAKRSPETVQNSFPVLGAGNVDGSICGSFGQTRHLAAATLSIYLYRGSYVPETASRPYRNSLRARCRDALSRIRAIRPAGSRLADGRLAAVETVPSGS